MLGFDNYFGGIATVVNAPAAFEQFNSWMSAAERQLTGLNYQGLTHLYNCASDSIQHYTSATIGNCKRLYDQLPAKLIFAKGDPAGLTKISQNLDARSCFIDLRCNVSFGIRNLFREFFTKYCLFHHLPLSSREGFGFHYCNLMDVDNDRLRIAPGLEDGATIDSYARFIHIFHKAISGCRANGISNYLTAVEAKEWVEG
jgi:hypothetical protein